MSIFIKGNVHGDVIEAGGVKNVTNNYHGEKQVKDEVDTLSKELLAKAVLAVQATIGQMLLMQ